jgi:hypothetical protein
MVLLAIITGVLLTTAIAVIAVTKLDSEGQRAGSASGGVSPVAREMQSAKTSERRRSERILCRVGVFAYSHVPGASPFHEETTTLEVSSHGGLLTLAASIFVGQKLLLTNIANQDERECRVVRFTHKHDEKREVAIEFTESSHDFWQTHAERPQTVT